MLFSLTKTPKSSIYTNNVFYLLQFYSYTPCNVLHYAWYTCMFTERTVNIIHAVFINENIKTVYICTNNVFYFYSVISPRPVMACIMLTTCMSTERKINIRGTMFSLTKTKKTCICTNKVFYFYNFRAPRPVVHCNLDPPANKYMESSCGL